MQNILKWFESNKLTVNATKTKIIPFTSYRPFLPDYNSISVGNRTLELVHTVKYLGIHIDSFLKWDVHARNITNKLRGLIYRFKQLVEFLSHEHLKTIYSAFVESILLYGIIGWGGIRNNHLNSINTVQKLILKIILKKPRRFSSNQVYINSKVLDIRQLFCFKTLCFLYSNRHYTYNVPHTYGTRQNTQSAIYAPVTHKALGQRSFCFIGSKLLNNLPHTLKKYNSVCLFKNKLKEWIFSKGRKYFANVIDPILVI